MHPLNSGHLRVLKSLSVIERCPLLGGNSKKIITFGTKRFGRFHCYSIRKVLRTRFKVEVSIVILLDSLPLPSLSRILYFI